MSYILRRRLIWLVIFMVWIGMVSAVVFHRDQEEPTLQPATGNNIVVETEVIGQESRLSLSAPKDEQGQEVDDEFFIQLRLDKEKAREQRINILREMINNPNVDQTMKIEAQNKLLKITEVIEKEMEIESLLRAQGYKEALVYVHENSVDVVVQSSGLSEDKVAIIGDIVSKVTGFSFDDITITEKQLKQ